MARYFIDLRDQDGAIIPDEEGADFGHLEEALEEAKASARDIVKQYVDSKLPLGSACVEIRDLKGQTVASVTIAEILAHPIHPAFKSRCSDAPQRGHH